MPFEIRAVHSDDLAALLDLYRHLNGDDDPLPDGPRRSELWRTFLSQPGLHCLVAEIDGVLISSYSLMIVPNLTRGGRPYGLIENVVTHADYRRRGIGRAMMKHALETAWSAGCYKVMLLSGTHRADAHKFYERSGFRSDAKLGFVAKPG